MVDNTIVTSPTGVGLSISGDTSDADVLVDGNSFGLVGGSQSQNDYAMVLDDLGSFVVSNNVVTGSSSEGLSVRGQTTLAPGSVGNCIVSNDAGVASYSSSPLTFENNW